MKADKATEPQCSDRVWQREELAIALGGSDDAALFAEADQIRRANVGDAVHLRGLIEFSSYCARNCHYCGLRTGRRTLDHYRLTDDEILSAAHAAKQLGYGSVVLQSGEDEAIRVYALCRIVERIKTETGLAVTLSAGEKSRDDYRHLKVAGADRYLMRFETSDPQMYGQLKPGSRLENRLECLNDLRELGFQVGSGCLIGLPGQSLEMLAEDLLLIKRLDLDMIGVGPFLPHPETPLANEPAGKLDITLRFVALLRLMNPNCHIPATTAMGTLHPEGRQLALKCGANVLMPNVTPVKYRKSYELYPNKICVTEDSGHCGNCTKAMLLGLGRRVGEGPGHSLR